MKTIMVTGLVAMLSLAGCAHLRDPITQADVVASWQCETSGFLRSMQTLTFRDDGTFSFHDTDTIVGLQMTGRWELEGDRFHLFPCVVSVKGETQQMSPEVADGLLTQPIIRRSGRISFLLEDGNEFKRMEKSVNKSR
jgi:hypothetical protein